MVALFLYHVMLSYLDSNFFFSRNLFRRVCDEVIFFYFSVYMA